MPFHPGDHVHVASLGKGIIREVRKGGRILVEIKGRFLLIDEKQLSPADPRKVRAKSVTADPVGGYGGPSLPAAASSIDLHGMTTAEGASALDAFLNDAILAGLAEVRVIHGRSGGRLKAVVHGRLKLMPSVRGFRLDPSNPGVTLVML